MTRKRRRSRIDDRLIIALNSVGLSLSTIAEALDCHPTTVTLRLQQQGLEPNDTRHAFMEDIFTALSPEHQIWLVEQMRHQRNIQDYLRQLIEQEAERDWQRQQQQGVS